jgi:transcriptional regulator GlxA family with amidase domain
MQIAIVLYPGMTALDAMGPYEVLRMMPDAEIRFVGHEVGPVAADSRVLFLGVTHTFAETPSPDMVLVPGSGTATATMMADKQVTEWLKQVHETTTWTTSVCTGALILGAAGLLEGLPATTHWTAQKVLPSLGAIAQPEERIVRSGKIVTAAGVSAGIDLGLWLAGEIHGREVAEGIQLMIEYDPQPPFDSGHPSKATGKLRKMGRLALQETARGNVAPHELAAIPRAAWQTAIGRYRRRKGLPSEPAQVRQ